MTVPSRERLRQAIGTTWEPSGPIAIRAGVNRKAAGTMLAALYRQDTTLRRRHSTDTGAWEYRRVER